MVLGVGHGGWWNGRGWLSHSLGPGVRLRAGTGQEGDNGHHYHYLQVCLSVTIHDDGRRRPSLSMSKPARLDVRRQGQTVKGANPV